MQFPATDADDLRDEVPPMSSREVSTATAVPAAARPVVADGERAIGEILVASGTLTPEQLARALRIQGKLEEWKPLGTVLIEMGMAPRAAVEEAIREIRRALSIEEILVTRGVLRSEQLAAAIESLGGRDVSPARHLVDAGTITERQYLEAFCEKQNLPLIEIDANMVDRPLLAKANLKYLARLRMLPVAMKNGRVSVVMERPAAAAVLAELQRIFGAPVDAHICEPARMTAAIAELEAEASGKVDITMTSAVQYRDVAQVVESAESRNVAQLLDSIILRAIRQGASDIHIDPDRARLRVRYRIDGELVRIGEYPVAQVHGLISRLKVLAKADIAERRAHQQGRIFVRNDGEEIDIRASFYVTVHGENAVLRLLRKTAVRVGLHELGFSPAAFKSFVHDVLEPSSGLLLVTGPTGSGKTTTLYGAVSEMVDDTRKIITCEDPVEYLVDGVTQCSIMDRPGLTFADSLRSILRQDPDVILVGEVRDRESAEMAIQCALTGHKVLTTLHTEDSLSALTRLLQMEIEPFLVGSTVSAVLAQRLLRRPCTHCRAEHQPTATEARALGTTLDEMSAFTFWRSTGCPSCHFTGYRGRVGVYELLLMSDALRDAVIQKRPPHELRRLAQEAPGFYSTQEDGLAKALRGLTTLSEVIANCPRVTLNKRLRHLQEIYA
jgi:type IV pilus assembly protein PilB